MIVENCMSFPSLHGVYVWLKGRKTKEKGK